MEFCCDSIGFAPISEQHSDEQKDFHPLFSFGDSAFELPGEDAVSPFGVSTTLSGTDEHYCDGSILNEAALDAVDTSCDLIPTPPPDNANLEPSPSSTHSASPAAALNSADEYITGSTLEETPLSSPSSSSCFNDDLHIMSTSSPTFGLNSTSCKQEQPSEEVEGQLGSLLSEKAAVGEAGSASLQMSEDEEKEASEEETGENESGPGDAPELQNVPKNVKLPQRKGGMQLWQFLYALLSDHSKKYSKLIEWTSNNRSREFRLLEPEAIAIWWGEHKNKKNMSYDKLSRSLRYYYDKGIIRKIPGERYVYQFCIDPELMYKHIGNSDCRPKLKPMPQAAQQATSEYQLKHGCPPALNKDPLYIAQGPVSLAMLRAAGGFHPSLDMPFLPPGYPGAPPFQHGFLDSGFMAPPGLEMPGPPVSGFPPHLDHHPMKPNLPPIRKCRSFDSSNIYIGESESPFAQPFVPAVGMAQSLPSVIHTPQPSLQDMSPPPASSGGVSPIAPNFSNRNELLEELIEFSTADSFTSQHQSMYSSCHEGNSSVFTNSHDIPITWNFN